MKNLFLILLVGAMCWSCFSKASQRPENDNIMTEKSFFDLKAVDMDGNTVSMDQYKGKKVVVVNLASKCGYTPQYEDLQRLYTENKNKMVILGFPCNDFGGQEPGSNEEIAQFCSVNYGVEFPLFDKITLKDGEKPEVYQWLTDKSKNGWNSDSPNWNFCKYVINEEGELTHFFQSKIKPLGEEMTAALAE